MARPQSNFRIRIAQARENFALDNVERVLSVGMGVPRDLLGWADLGFP